MNVRALNRGKWWSSTHLWLITAESTMTKCQTLESNRELYITTAHDILNLELCKLRVEPELLDNARVFARGEAGVVL
jgi:hypothetical protein